RVRKRHRRLGTFPGAHAREGGTRREAPEGLRRRVAEGRHAEEGPGTGAQAAGGEVAMRANPHRIAGVLATLALFSAAFVPTVTRAATITIINNDGAGEGFNDPTPAAPVGGNPG